MKVKPQAMLPNPPTITSRKVLQQRMKISSSATSSQNLKHLKSNLRKGPQKVDTPVDKKSTLFKYANKIFNDESDVSDNNSIGNK